MPHTTLSETPSPYLGTISTLEVWDDPRRMTTFSTFHQNNENNGSFAETSFLQAKKSDDIKQPEKEINGNIEQERSNGFHEKNGNGVHNDIKHADIYSRNNFRISPSKHKTSPKFGKYVTPIISVPPRLDLKLRSISPGGTITQDDTLKNKRLLTSFGNGDNNGVDSDSKDKVEQNIETNSSNMKYKQNNGLNGNNDEELEGDSVIAKCDIVDIKLGPSDKRFGFSVVGGCDEGFWPRIENITHGGLFTDSEPLSCSHGKKLEKLSSIRVVSNKRKYNTCSTAACNRLPLQRMCAYH